MRSCLTASTAHQRRVRRLTGLAFFTAALALAASPFIHPVSARAYDGDYYEWCIHNSPQGQVESQRGNGMDFCCSRAGGELVNDMCYPPAPLSTAVPTVTQQVLPPVILVPPP